MVPLAIIQRAAHAAAATVQNMGIDLRGLHILVAQQFLDRADVIAVFKQMAGEAMAQACFPESLFQVTLVNGVCCYSCCVSATATRSLSPFPEQTCIWR